MVHVVDSAEMLAPGTYRLRRVGQETWARFILDRAWAVYAMNEAAYLHVVAVLRTVIFPETGKPVLRDGDSLAIVVVKPSATGRYGEKAPAARNAEYLVAEYSV